MKQVRTLIAEAVRLELSRQLDQKPITLDTLVNIELGSIVDQALDCLADQIPEFRRKIELIKQGAVKV